MTRTIVVGIDGACPELIEPWREAGRLPALDRLLEQGVSSRLESVLPPVTSPNWKAYATGKNPGKLGIYWWWNVDVAEQRVYRPVERYNDHPAYWDYLAEQERVGVIGVPTTYPPSEAPEFVVSGPPDAPSSGFTHPPELEARLEDRFDYRASMESMLRDGDEEAIEEALSVIDSRFEAAQWLLEEYELNFLQVTTFYVNAMHHNLWDHEGTRRAWELIDEHLGRLLELEDTNVVIMSDHGHAKIETVFNINAWLEREGYLAYDSDVADALYSVGINATRLKRLISRGNRHLPAVDLQDIADRLAPGWLLRRLPDEDGELGGSKHEAIDWDASAAVAGAQGPVYLTCSRDDSEYERVRDDLIEGLRSVTGPDGRPIARDVYRVEEVYNGPYLEEAPDVVIDKAPHVNVREGIGADEVFADIDSTWKGVNRREGLFAAAGPEFGRGEVEDLSILDLAPTLLTLRGHSVPQDMDGQIRWDVFSDIAPVAAGSVRRDETA